MIEQDTTNTTEENRMTSTETQLAEVRAELEREHASRLAWAIEADRLDMENEQLRAELAEAKATP